MSIIVVHHLDKCMFYIVIAHLSSLKYMFINADVKVWGIVRSCCYVLKMVKSYNSKGPNRYVMLCYGITMLCYLAAD